MIFAIIRSPCTNKKDGVMHDATITTKLIGQLKKFLGRLSPHFHKPVTRFIGDMIYGIMAEKDVKLSSVVRALKMGITPKKSRPRRWPTRRSSHSSDSTPDEVHLPLPV
jgi:hypothetical protein